MSQARYIMVGGFLGAGKTTSLIRLATKLTGQGQKVGLITNDQAADLVDTALVKNAALPVEEIAGGCFCCRFNSLKEAADRLTRIEKPDVFLAEPVGSCTDLMATVSYPLRRIYGASFHLAPLSVLLDPNRAQRVFGLQEGRNFSEKVRYIYLKQIEEAEALVINKVDLLQNADKTRLEKYLKLHYPNKKLFFISSTTGQGFDAWSDWLTSSDMGHDPCMPIDYDTYADGEAALGWLNATVSLAATQAVDGNKLLQKLATQLATAFAKAAWEVAHLKMTLSPEDGSGEIASINLVSSELVPELGMTLMDQVTQGQLIVNIRAEAPPDGIKTILESTLAESFKDCLVLEHLEHFRPGRPIPTHRYAGAYA